VNKIKKTKKTFFTSMVFQELREAKWIPARLMESLQIMLEFFHASGKGLDLSDINCPLYKVTRQRFY